MSRTFGRLMRPISQAGVLALALIATPSLHGQDGARALFRQVSIPAPSQPTSHVRVAAADAERALLEHVGVAPAPTEQQIELLASDTVAQVIDGARALMGKAPRIEARRSLVAKSR